KIGRADAQERAQSVHSQTLDALLHKGHVGSPAEPRQDRVYQPHLVFHRQLLQELFATYSRLSAVKSGVRSTPTIAASPAARPTASTKPKRATILRPSPAAPEPSRCGVTLKRAAPIPAARPRISRKRFS